MRFRYLAGLSLTVALAAPAAVPAQVLGVTTQNGQFLNNGQTWSLGYFFNVTSPFTVTQLAFWDDLDNGLAINHDVGIYDPLGNLLVSATVSAGTGGTLLDHHRLVNITPLTLAIGAGYQVLGVTGFEKYSFNGVLTNAFGIQYVSEAFCNSSTLVPSCRPPEHINGFFGGNFAGFSTTSTVPEPASMALLGTGLVGVFGATRRRFRKPA